MSNRYMLLTTVALFFMVSSLTQAYPRRYRNGPVVDNAAQSSIDSSQFVASDLQPAASGHHNGGRVHIKVYRGPSDGHHAAHGFWVKQPADDERHH